MTQDFSDFQWYVEFKQSQLIQQAVNNLLEFQSPDVQKIQALYQLQTLSEIIGGKMTNQQFQQVFKALAKTLLNYYDIEEFKIEIGKTATYLSKCLTMEQNLLIVFDSLKNDLDKEQLISINTQLHLMSQMICNPQGNELKLIINGFKLMSQILMENEKTCQIGSEILERFLSEKFNVILNDQEMEDLFRLVLIFDANQKISIQKVLSLIVQRLQISENEFLYKSSKNFIEKIYLEKSYLKWEGFSLERKQFHSMIMSSPQTACKFMDLILEILQSLISNDDFMVKFSALESFNRMIEVGENVIQFSEEILTQIIQKSLVWKMGTPNNKIRKAGMICFDSLIDKKFISIEALLKHFSEYLSQLKSCSDDDKAQDLRLVTTLFFSKYIDYIGNHLSRDHIGDFYVIVIQRLDDASDQIRIAGAQALQKLFKCQHCDFSTSIKEYIIQTMLLHMDDSNNELRHELQKALIEFGRIDREMTVQMAETALPKFRFNENCLYVINNLKNQIIS